MNTWGISHKNYPHLDMSFVFNLNSWMLWSPVWLPMIFVITPPLSEFCNFRTGIFLFLLLFIRWNRGHLEQWSHMLKNAKWTTFLFTILVPRLWPTRIERHCNQCESILAAQIQLAKKDQVVGMISNKISIVIIFLSMHFLKIWLYFLKKPRKESKL